MPADADPVEEEAETLQRIKKAAQEWVAPPHLRCSCGGTKSLVTSAEVPRGERPRSVVVSAYCPACGGT